MLSMFRFNSARIYNTKISLFNGGATTTLHCLPTPFLIRSLCANNDTDETSFTVSYLINSCGLSEEKSISVARKIQLKSSSRPDTVLALFSHEFPNTDMSKIFCQHPSYLLCNADKTLKPKIEFLKSLGFSVPDLAKLLLKAPTILRQSLEKKMMPFVAFLETILPTESITRVINRSPWLFVESPQKRLAPNIALLRSVGVSDHNIVKLLVSYPTTLTKSKRFNAIVKETIELQFDPSKFAFVRAIHALSSMSKSSWEAKTDIYKSWGWSNEDILMAFRKQPQCMALSKKKIMGSMEFIVNKLGYDSLLMARYPLLLMYSLENRIIPRLSVIHVLVSNNLVEKDCNINSVLVWTDETFLKMYVTKFVKKVPQLLDVFEGKTKAL